MFRKKSQPTALRTWLENDNPLQSIIGKADQLNAIQQLVQHHLADKQLAQHCHVASYQNNKLLLIVDNAIWAHHLRFQSLDLLERLKGTTALRQLNEIQYRIDPTLASSASTKKTWAKPQLSQQSAEVIQATANSVTNPELKAALLKLSQHSAEGENSGNTKV